MQIKDKNNEVSFGNQQTDINQLFSNDWLLNNKDKKSDKMYGKYRKNKKKEREFLKQLQTLSVISISDRPKLFLFSGAKVNKVLKMQSVFRIFNVSQLKQVTTFA
jgi:hypothetical protein